MERPVRSFKSFVRSVPQTPSPLNQKPLPPTPTTPDSSVLPPTPLQTIASSETTSITTSWRAPPEWQCNQASPSGHSFPTSLLFSARDYSLLLPESSPGAGDLPVDTSAQRFESSAPPLRQLEPTQEGSIDRSNLPPHYPSRPSPFKVLSAESDPGMMSASIEYHQSRPPPDISTSASFPDISDKYLQNTEQRSSNFSHRMSDASTKARAFASLGIGSPRNSETPWEDWKNKDSQQQEEDDLANLTIHSKQNQLHHQEQTKLDEHLEDDELTQKLQLLSFAQDYHKVLTEQYHESDGRNQNQHRRFPAPTNGRHNLASSMSNAQSKDHELLPQPLAWKKDFKNPSPAASSPNLLYQAESESKHRRRHKRIVSWVHRSQEQQRNRRSADKNPGERSPSEPMESPRKHGPVSELDKLLMKEIRLPNLLAHTKRLGSPREHKRPVEDRDIDQSLRQPASPSPSREKPASVLRLPGGFAIVRQTPSDTPHSATASTHDVSVAADTPQKDSRPNSDRSSRISTSHASHVSQQRISQYSQHSQALVAPTMAVKRLRDSNGSATSPPSRSNNSTPPISPLAHEIPLPRTPPPIPTSPSRPSNPPRVSSPLSYEHETISRERHTENEEEHSTHVHKVVNKVKGARDAWRKHQQDVKHEKLKQSIKVLGPTDPAVMAGYVKREGRRPGEENMDSSRMPGYMVTGPV